jgi:2,3-bisphosphoglycerate-independent phosphoglycerate mutase
MVGRYYPMDRDNRWDRIERGYKLLTQAKADYQFDNALDALEAAYKRDENDEFVLPTSLRAEGEEAAVISDNDAVLFMNFRADRARALTHAFVDEDFSHFEREVTPQLADFVMTTEYAADIKTSCAFPPNSLKNVLGDYLAQLGKTQLRIAETEKYAHVTFFFSGGREALFDGEERIMVPSPDVATYDLQPEMSAPELTDKLIAAITSHKYDLIVCNYANGDMVGHTGVYEAAVKAVETLDECLGRIQSALQETGGEALITADHGNCEQMMDYVSGQKHTQHTTEKVPLVYMGPRGATLDPAGGKLADMAPTLLAMMNIVQPPEMTGKNLIELAS